MRSRKMIVSAAFVVAVMLLAAATAGAQDKIVQAGKVTTLIKSSKTAAAWTAADYASAKPMPMPSIDALEAAYFEMEAAAAEGPAGFEPGAAGNGKTRPVKIPAHVGEESDAFAPQEHGSSNHVFTTSRVDLSGDQVSRSWPFRAAGKLYFKIGTGSYVCSASLIKRGVIVTAAHCVASFGKNQWYSGFQFVPAKSGASAPYGTWGWSRVAAMTSYLNGTDYCAPGASGVVCRNDVAVIVMAPSGSSYPGTSTGWYGYGWNGWGFAASKAQLTQLGYPVSHDSGNMMQRTESQGFVGSSTSFAGNTIWGSRQTGGSSGGPELVNLGVPASISTTYGTYSTFNIVVGVTSWGYISSGPKQQGASAFTSSNITVLVSYVCGLHPAACS